MCGKKGGGGRRWRFRRDARALMDGVEEGGKGRLGFENVMRICGWVYRFEGFGGSRVGL